MKIMARQIQRLRQMPEVLATLTCIFMFFGPLSIILAILPSSPWTYEGRAFSYQEFWRSGGGLLVVATGITMILLAIAFYRAQHWVRLAIPLGFVALTVYAALKPDSSFSYEWIATLCWVFLSYWYFNRKRSVVEYFSKRIRTPPTSPENKQHS